METHITLSIVNTKLREGQSLEDVAFELNFSLDELNAHLAKEGYVYHQETHQYKR